MGRGIDLIAIHGASVILSIKAQKKDVRNLVTAISVVLTKPGNILPQVADSPKCVLKPMKDVGF